MSENVQPTAGLWRVRDEDGSPLIRIMADGRVIAHCIPQQFMRSFGMGHPTDQILRAYSEAEANAKLIVEAVAARDASLKNAAILDIYRNALNKIIRQTTDQEVAVPLAENAFAAVKALREKEPT